MMKAQNIDYYPGEKTSVPIVKCLVILDSLSAIAQVAASHVAGQYHSIQCLLLRKIIGDFAPQQSI